MSNKIWTRNYDNLFSSVFGTFGYTGTTTSPNYNIPWVRDRSGTWRGPDSATTGDGINAALLSLNSDLWGYGDYSTNLNSSPRINVEVGTGNGTVSADDYQLFLPAESSNFKIGTVSKAWVYNEETHSYTKTFKIPVAYSGANPVIVTEFCIYAILCDGWNGNYPTGHSYMLYHEFLDAPVTLQQNDTLELTVEQTIVQPNYTPYPTE